MKFCVIVDVESSRAIRQAEVGADKTMIERTEHRFGLKPARLAADTAYGSAATLDWIVNDKMIAPHIHPQNDAPDPAPPFVGASAFPDARSLSNN